MALINNKDSSFKGKGGEGTGHGREKCGAFLFLPPQYAFKRQSVAHLKFYQSCLFTFFGNIWIDGVEPSGPISLFFPPCLFLTQDEVYIIIYFWRWIKYAHSCSQTCLWWGRENRTELGWILQCAFCNALVSGCSYSSCVWSQEHWQLEISQQNLFCWIQ